nr:gamma-secretase subunit Aph-1b-like [Nothobranchius furzeri]
MGKAAVSYRKCKSCYMTPLASRVYLCSCFSCRKANEGLLILSQEETMPISIRQLAYVSGLGFGFMSGAFSVVSILADSAGPGTVGIHGDSQHYFLSSAFMTKAIILLHMFWGVVFFDACERQRLWAVTAVVVSHLIVSCLVMESLTRQMLTKLSEPT